MIFDITFCANRNCPKAKICKRSVLRLEGIKNIPHYLSYAGFQPDKNGNCEYFITPVRKTKNER